MRRLTGSRPHIVPMLIDTHCHLADPAYDADRDEVLARAWAAGVSPVVVIGESPAAADRALALAATDPRLVGHRRRPSSRRRRLESAASAGSERRSGDRGWWPSARWGWTITTTTRPRDAQRRAFEAQLDLAREAGKPAVIHAREADDDVAAMLRPHAGVPAILHSFSSGPRLLRAGLDLRHYVSFSGMVTFKNWHLDEAILESPPTGCWSRRTGRTWRPFPTAASGTSRPSCAIRSSGSPRCAALPVEELIAVDGRKRARASFGPVDTS